MMRHRAGDAFVAWGLALAVLVEVGQITLQQWRGVPSHFNRATALDALIPNGIEPGAVRPIAVVRCHVAGLGRLADRPCLDRRERCDPAPFERPDAFRQIAPFSDRNFGRLLAALGDGEPDHR